MNSDVEKMLKTIDIIRGCQEQITKIWEDDRSGAFINSERDELIRGFENLEETAKKNFEEALISLIDERIKTIVGERK
jgi:hypothetical protein